MRVLVLVVAALLARPSSSSACSYGRGPTAYFFERTNNQVLGRRPLIGLWLGENVKVAVRRVLETCPLYGTCRGTDVAIERSGAYARPKVALPAGARIQVLMDGKVVADETITTGKPVVLPSRIRLLSAKHEVAEQCETDGVVVRLATDTRWRMNAWLLVYLEKPDPDRPFAKLAHVVGVQGEMKLKNVERHPPWLRSPPNRLWVIATDADGNQGPVIEVR